MKKNRLFLSISCTLILTITPAHATSQNTAHQQQQQLCAAYLKTLPAPLLQQTHEQLLEAALVNPDLPVESIPPVIAMITHSIPALVNQRLEQILVHRTMQNLQQQSPAQYAKIALEILPYFTHESATQHLLSKAATLLDTVLLHLPGIQIDTPQLNTLISIGNHKNCNLLTFQQVLQTLQNHHLRTYFNLTPYILSLTHAPLLKNTANPHALTALVLRTAAQALNTPRNMNVANIKAAFQLAELGWTHHKEFSPKLIQEITMQLQQFIGNSVYKKLSSEKSNKESVHFFADFLRLQFLLINSFEKLSDWALSLTNYTGLLPSDFSTELLHSFETSPYFAPELQPTLYGYRLNSTNTTPQILEVMATELISANPLKPETFSFLTKLLTHPQINTTIEHTVSDAVINGARILTPLTKEIVMALLLNRPDVVPFLTQLLSRADLQTTLVIQLYQKAAAFVGNNYKNAKASVERTQSQVTAIIQSIESLRAALRKLNITQTRQDSELWEQMTLNLNHLINRVQNGGEAMPALVHLAPRTQSTAEQDPLLNQISSALQVIAIRQGRLSADDTHKILSQVLQQQNWTIANLEEFTHSIEWAADHQRLTRPQAVSFLRRVLELLGNIARNPNSLDPQLENLSITRSQIDTLMRSYQ